MRGVREMCGELSRPRDPDCAGQTSGNFGGGKKGGVSQKGVHFLLLLPGNVSRKGDFGEKGAVGRVYGAGFPLKSGRTPFTPPRNSHP